MADDNETTLFDLPNSPEEFGVVLPSSDLRTIDFSALDHETLFRAFVEYIRTYYPNEFSDIVANNGVMILGDVISNIGDILSTRGDVLARESFLPTSTTEDSVNQHLALINKTIQRQTPATVNVAITLASPVATTVRIAAGTKFSVTGPDNRVLNYEIFRSPTDYTNSIDIPPGKLGIIAHGVEGVFATPITVNSTGDLGQIISIDDTNILDDPITVLVGSGNNLTEWTRVDVIENSSSNDKTYQVIFVEDGMLIKFGNNVNGKAPISGQIIEVRYRTGGGKRGRIVTGSINETRSISPDAPASASVEVRFNNLEPSIGGFDRQSLREAKALAPREAATLKSAVSGNDYAVLANGYSHPVFGSVLKSVATVRTSINANIVELYVLASSNDDTPALPSEGLKVGLKSYLEELNVLTDEISVLDGIIKPVDTNIQVVIARSSDNSKVKSDVDSAISDFFDINDRNMGDPLYVSRLYDAVQSVDGVRSVTVFSPLDDILNTGVLSDGDTDDNTVGINELIVLGNLQVDFFSERQN